MRFDYSLTFACFNSVDYTRACVESLVKVGTPLDRLVVVDNGSTDQTRQYLESLNLGGRIYNKDNLACGVAWNQGILHQQAEWTVVMNNDLIVSPQWVENLIQTAIDNNLKVISPARIDGTLDYDFDVFAHDASDRMGKVLRKNTQHAVCVCIHKSVFLEVGFFRATPRLLGFEDTIFFNDLKLANVQRAISGSVWLHHFGSVTQKEMKQSMGKSEKDDLLKVNDRRLLQQSWLERKFNRFSRKRQEAAWQASELKEYAMTLIGERQDQHFIWH